MSPPAAAVRAETDAFFASRLARPTIESIMEFTPPLQPRTALEWEAAVANEEKFAVVSYK
jgi:hypothetical protein